MQQIKQKHAAKNKSNINVYTSIQLQINRKSHKHSFHVDAIYSFLIGDATSQFAKTGDEELQQLEYIGY